MCYKTYIICVVPKYFVAQNGFARLMGLEDSTPLTTENEGLDSGLGDAPPTSEKKMHSSTDHLEPVKTEILEVVEKANLTHKTRGKKRISKLDNASLHPLLIPDESKQEPLRKSSRKMQTKDFQPDKILEQKQEKSVAKVSEWLMKVPNEGSLELDKTDEETEESDSCSSTPTVDVKLHFRDMNPKREDRAKVLEEQVFGAVYKRRGNRTTSPPHVYVEPPVTTKTQSPGMISKRRTRSGLIPADFYKEMSFEDKNETKQAQQIIEDATSGDVFQEGERIEVIEKNNIDRYGEELNNMPESDINDGSGEIFCPRFDIEEQQPTVKSDKKVQNTLHEVDSDLQEQANAKTENTEQKKTNKRKGKNTKPEKGKPVRVSKPLVLVRVQNEDTSPKTRTSEEVQVQIETYPSSEDLETPVLRSTRRSKRLQLFAEEVQEHHKKANFKVSVPEEDSNVAELPGEVKDVPLDDTAKNENVEKMTKRNGCIYDRDLGIIESMEPVEQMSLRPAEDSIADIPNAEILSEAGALYVPEVPSPTETAVIGPTLESEDLTNQISTKIHLETSACHTECAVPENEDDKNDSEMDTEQLLRSFKATKRKSFHLGGPNVKRSRSLDKESMQGAASEKTHKVCPVGSTNQEVLRDKENVFCSDVISPSNSPSISRKSVAKKPDEVIVEASIPDTSCSGQDSAACYGLSLSVSSALSPNKVSKHEVESLHLSVVPQVVDSGLRFAAVEHDELKEASQTSERTMRDAAKGKKLRDGISMRKHRSVNTDERIAIVESLTPDGLVTPIVQMVGETKLSNGSGELSAHSFIQSNPTRKRKAQRLESSPESDTSESKEDLPSLTQIFGTSSRPPAAMRDQGDLNETNRCELADAAERMSRPAACPSPDCVNSSQASVDLFGTPDECK